MIANAASAFFRYASARRPTSSARGACPRRAASPRIKRCTMSSSALRSSAPSTTRIVRGRSRARLVSSHNALNGAEPGFGSCGGACVTRRHYSRSVPDGERAQGGLALFHVDLEAHRLRLVLLDDLLAVLQQLR